MSGFELLAAASAGLGLVGSIASGVAADNAAQFEAAQMEAKGKEEFAAAQREAQAKRREGALVNSRAQALAAASGAGAGTDAPTIVKLMSDTTGEAAYNASTVMYGGEQRKRGLFDSARGRRAEGRASLLGGILGGVGQFAGGLAKAKGFG